MYHVLSSPSFTSLPPSLPPSIVCDDHRFKDEYLFFRFKNDETSGKTFGRRVGVAKKTSSKKSVGAQNQGSGDDTSEGRGSFASSESGDALGGSGETRDDE